MDFKLWLYEIVEPQKPKKINKSTFIKNKGTNIAKPILQYYWKTSLGNKIKLQLDFDGEKYDVNFYVNDTHYDDASAREGRIRDPEILNSVIYVLKKKMDELNAKKFTFKGQDSPKDYKMIYNLPLEPTKNNLVKTLESLLNFLKNRTPVLIPPSQERLDLFKKFNRPAPGPRPDFSDETIDKLNIILEKIKANQLADYDQIFQSYIQKEFEAVKYDSNPLIQMIKRYNQIIESQTGGWNRYKNRRAEVYDKLMQRFFSDWKIERSRNNFTLTR